MKKNPNIPDDNSPEGTPENILLQNQKGPSLLVKLTRASGIPSPEELTDDKILWTAIRNRTEAIGFEHYFKLIDQVLCGEEYGGTGACKEERSTNLVDLGSPPISDRKTDLLNDYPSIYGVDAYNLFKLTTQAFLLFETGVVIKPSRVLKPTDKDDFLDEEKVRLGSGSVARACSN
jgi:hypothetical protein